MLLVTPRVRSFILFIREEEEEVNTLQLLLLSGQTWSGTAPTCREPIKHCMMQLVTQHTAVMRQTPAAKSRPSGSNTLHLVPLERLRNLVATHPAAIV